MVLHFLYCFVHSASDCTRLECQSSKCHLFGHGALLSFSAPADKPAASSLLELPITLYFRVTLAFKCRELALCCKRKLCGQEMSPVGSYTLRTGCKANSSSTA